MRKLQVFLFVILIIGFTIGFSYKQQNQAKIKALIENLAVSQNVPKQDRQRLAFESAAKIGRYGKEALPYLVAHLDDKRPAAAAFSRIAKENIGTVCFAIIRNITCPLPINHQGSFYRTGADGKLHERPFYLYDGPFTINTAKDWVTQRENKTLKQMQIETLEWMIESEETIGFQNEEDKKSFLYPLEEQLKKIKAK